MSIRNQIMSDVKEAMKAKEQIRLTTLRSIQSEIKNKEIEVRPNEISDDDVMAVLKKLSKQRKDSIEQFSNAGRTDLVEKETEELKVIEGYLPEQMSREQLEEIVTAVIAELGVTEVKQMGQVMKAAMAKTKGQADNKMISEIIKAKLS